MNPFALSLAFSVLCLATNGVSLANAFTASNRFVEVTVSNRSPILPRQQILTTPFAFQAANSAKLAGYDWSALFGTNNPVTGTIPFSKLPQRQVGTTLRFQRMSLQRTQVIQLQPTSPE